MDDDARALTVRGRRASLAVLGNLAARLAVNGTDLISGRTALARGPAGWAPTITFAIAVVLVLHWLSAASRAAYRTSEDAMKYSASDALVYWFVPPFNLWVPYRMVREIERAPQGGLTAKRAWLVPAWWVAFVLAMARVRVSGLDAPLEIAFSVAHLVSWLVAGGLFLAVIAHLNGLLQEGLARPAPSVC